MTSSKRVKCTIAHIEPDTVPILEFVYSRNLYKEVLGSIPKSYNAENIMQITQKIGYDAAVIPLGGFSGFEYNAAAKYKDQWGTTYQKDEGTWPSDSPVDFPVKTRQDWKNYEMPDVNLKSGTDGIKTAVKMNTDDEKFLIGSIRGPFSGSWMITGFEQMCINMYEDPQLTHEILNKVTDFFIEGGLHMVQEGADALLFADDYGSSSAGFMSRDMFTKFILPCVKKMIDTFHSKKIKIFMHSDGRISDYIDLLVDSKIDGYHPIERAAGMDIGEIKKNYGKEITLIGNVNNKTTLVEGSVSDVEEEVKECIKTAAKGGGYILASDHSVHDDVPNKNVFAMYEAGRKFGKYPLK